MVPSETSWSKVARRDCGVRESIVKSMGVGFVVEG
jgi:hypothetical protein